MASSVESPHISGCGRRPTQVCGRSGRPNSAQWMSAVRCGQRSPAGLPFGSAGSDGEIDGAIQHAPQLGRHSMRRTVALSSARPRRSETTASVPCRTGCSGRRQDASRRPRHDDRRSHTHRHTADSACCGRELRRQATTGPRSAARTNRRVLTSTASRDRARAVALPALARVARSSPAASFPCCYERSRIRSSRRTAREPAGTAAPSRRTHRARGEA
jgi:hypothetical protein